MDITPLLKLMAERQASDLFFSAGAPVNIKIDGVTHPANQQILTGDQIKRIAYKLMDASRIAHFEEEMEMNFGYPVEGLGNFRVNIFRQRGDVALVIRFIRDEAPGIADLNLPPILEQLIMQKRGIVLVVGASGSGKSTTLASMIEHRSRTRTGHILTVEDPIEYVFQHRKSIVNQREIGIDTLSYTHALKNAMREAPDVLMIGETRDRETIQHAINYAQAGHLILSTLHANNSYHMLSRIISFFPHDARDALLMDLSVALKAVISQRLIRGMDGKLVPAVEVLLNTNRVAELIRAGEIDQIREAMESSVTEGSQTFEQSLFELYADGKITLDEALANADSPTNLSWKIHNDAKAHQKLEESRVSGIVRPAATEATPRAGEGVDFSFDLKLDD